MKNLVLSALAMSLAFAGSASAQNAPGFNHGGGAPGHAPNAIHTPSRSPSYAMHPGARGFVHRPMWRHPVAVAHHPHFHFHFHGHSYVVIAGPIFVQPWAYYPYVSTPYYPASFYDPNDPGAGYNLYYCPSPAGYFPDVTDCPAGWWSTAPEDGPEMSGSY